MWKSGLVCNGRRLPRRSEALDSTESKVHSVNANALSRMFYCDRHSFLVPYQIFALSPPQLSPIALHCRLTSLVISDSHAANMSMANVYRSDYDGDEKPTQLQIKKTTKSGCHLLAVPSRRYRNTSPNTRILCKPHSLVRFWPIDLSVNLRRTRGHNTWVWAASLGLALVY